MTEIQQAKSGAQEPIAIIGIACEFAGGISSPFDLWHALVNSQDVGSEIPIERFDIHSHSAHMMNQDNGELRKRLVHRGYFLPSSKWDTFEPSFFGLSDGEAATVDPCHRLLLHKFVHLVDDAGYSLDRVRGSRTSVHIGQFSISHQEATLNLKPEFRTRLHGPNIMLYNAAARLSYHFDLHGPNLSFDVACSSSLQAVHMAIQTLRSGEADMAVAGGVNAFYTPVSHLNITLLGAISVDGRSRSFSTDANGYAKGEGLGLVLLKRLKDAERDGDKIYCVIRDVLTNHDGSEGKISYVIPSPAGQYRLLNDIYEQAEFDRKRIFYVEAHGTGTPVGDPIEANTLGRFFNRSQVDSPLLIGSVKSNLGHTEGTAGVAALIKVALCMRYRAIPPNMHFKALNPKIDAKRFNIHVVQHLTPFPTRKNNNDKQEPVAIGINSFGMGGNNAHAIVEEYHPSERTNLTKDSSATNGYHHLVVERQKPLVFLITAKSQESLRKQVDLFNTWLQQQKYDKQTTNAENEKAFLARVSRQLLLRRTISYEHLAIIVATDLAELREKLDAYLADSAAPGLHIAQRPQIPVNADLRLCYVFSGQGPQWWAMGRQLYSTEPVFRQWIEQIDVELAKITQEWRLLDELIGKTEAESRINDTNISQPALFSIQVALTALLASWGIYPSAIVSHSAGEQAAAFIGGRVNLPEAVRIVYHRSRLQHRNTRQGGRMLAVSMSEKEARELLRGIEDVVHIAAVNSARSVTLSGDEAIIDEIQSILTVCHPNVFKARLRIENAFHSHQMDRFQIKEDMLSSLSNISGLPLQDKKQLFNEKCAQAQFYSSVLGKKMDSNIPVDAHYWWANVRQEVRFNDAIQAILSDGAADAFLEVSPHPVLATSIREICEAAGTQAHIFPTLKRKEDEEMTLLATVAQISHSSTVWQNFLDSRYIQGDDDSDHYEFDRFPVYAFNTSPCWYESRESVLERRAMNESNHPLLGIRLWTQQKNPTWRSLINLKLAEHAFLIDHRIHDGIMFPAAGYLELALAGCRELQIRHSNDDSTHLLPIAFEHVEFHKALLLNESELVEIYTEITWPLSEWSIYSRPWESSGQDCMRSAGMAGTDVLSSYTDAQALNTFSLRTFTLHARGRIDTGAHLKLHAARGASEPSVFLGSDEFIMSSMEPASVYARLSTRGYQYGNEFQVTESMAASKSKVIGQIQFKQGSDQYYLYPVAVDGSLHAPMTILPGSDTLLPIGIEKMIIYGSTLNRSRLVTYTSYHSTVAGISQDHTQAFDMIVYDAKEKTPLFAFDTFVTQGSRGKSRSKTTDKSVFEKMKELAEFPNADYSEHIETILSDYCLQRKWYPIDLEMIDLVRDDLQASNFDLSLLPEATTNMYDADKQLSESIEQLNELASEYAHLAIEQLSHLVDADTKPETLHQLIPEDHSAHMHLFLDSCLALAHKKISSSVTQHTTQLRIVKLFERFPLIKPLLTVISAIGTQLMNLIVGKQDISEVFTGDSDNLKALEELQVLISQTKTYAAFQILVSHLKKIALVGSKPTRKLRVFFIGSGVSANALPILEKLTDLVQEANGHVELVYTENDSKLLEQAKETIISSDPRLIISYRVFDIENVDTDSLIEAHDIVFVSNILGGAMDKLQVISDLRSLLTPGGLLLIVELTIAHSYFNLLFGISDSWWRGNGEKQGVLNVEEWKQLINGVGGFDKNVLTSPSNQFGNTLILAQKSTQIDTLAKLSERNEQGWLILGDNRNNLSSKILSYLPCPNIEVEIRDPNSQYQESKAQVITVVKQMLAKYKQLNIVFGWSLSTLPLGEGSDDNNEAAFHSQDEIMCGLLVHVLQTIQSELAEQANQPYPYVFVLTENAQTPADKQLNASPTPILGLTRSLFNEYKRYHLKLVDLQPNENNCNGNYSDSFVNVIVRHLIQSRNIHELAEIVIQQDEHDSQVITRLDWKYETVVDKTTLDDKVTTRTIIPSEDGDKFPFRLQVAESRFLADLVWVREPSIDEILPGQLEVRVHCVGLNFRDVLKARGMYPHMRRFAQFDKDQPYEDRDTVLGFDFMGSVVRVNNPDSCLKPGDRVYGSSVKGVFHSHLIVNEFDVVSIPQSCSLTDEELAALPCGFLTAFYALKLRVQLTQGQTVLVHAASGATGQAFIQYAQLVGAQVLATAGSEEKRRMLREHFGIKHVFNSRDLSFVNSIREIYPKGIDVIVNSLTGSLMQESVKLLAPRGHFVELGKRDIFDKTFLPLYHLKSDCSYHIIDLIMLNTHGHMSPRVWLEEILEHFRTGKFKPIEPTVVVEPSDVIETFTKVNRGEAMGKSVIRIFSSKQPLQIKDDIGIVPNSQHTSDMFPSLVCNHGTIIISGGFGGLGLTMTQWMIEERGVKRVCLMSRRKLVELETPDNPQYDDWLRVKHAAKAHNAHVDVVQADVTRFSDVKNLIVNINKTQYPVRGILHAAVIVEDHALNKLTDENIVRMLGPKVRGAWNFHHACQVTQAPIHFFVMFSSIRNHLLDMGSGGYNAGNQFLDALADFRVNRLGLPALSIGLPAVSGAGMFHRYREFLTTLQSTQGFALVPNIAVFKLFDRLHRVQWESPCPLIFAVNWENLRQRVHQLPTHQLSDVVRQQAISSQERNPALNNMSNILDIETICDRTQATIAHLLGSTSVDRIDVSRSLVAQGLDSLAAVSLYNWLGKEFNVFVPLADLLQGISVKIIGQFVMNKIQEQQGANGASLEMNSTETGIAQAAKNYEEDVIHDVSTDTGVNDVQCILPCSKTGNTLFIHFFVADSTKTKFQALIAKCAEYFGEDRTPGLFLLDTSTMKNVEAMISQMRRIQPRGPYSLVAIGENSSHVIMDISNQLQKYESASISRIIRVESAKEQNPKTSKDHHTTIAGSLEDSTTVHRLVEKLLHDSKG
ncbi:unnamed protein product [Rotaria socialis]